MNNKKLNAEGGAEGILARTAGFQKTNTRMGDFLADQINSNSIASTKMKSQKLDKNQEIFRKKEQKFPQILLDNSTTNERSIQFLKTTEKSKDAIYISPEEIYNRFLKYFQALDEFSPQAQSENYHLNSFWCGEIFLDSLKNNQNLILIKDNNTIYHADFENGQWYERQNNLLPSQIQKIKKLPQNKQEISKEYSGRYLARLLCNKLTESKMIQKAIKWKFLSGKCQDKYYSFQIQQILHPKQIVVQGKDEEDSNIFSAKMHQTGFIDVLNNQIPLKHIHDLLLQQTMPLN